MHGAIADDERLILAIVLILSIILENFGRFENGLAIQERIVI